jgi:hypothetical protein
MLVPILGIHTYNTAYSSISSSFYDNMQKKFDNLLPFDVPQLEKEGKTDTKSKDDSESQSAQKKFDNLLPFDVPQLEKEGKTDTKSKDDSESQSAQMNSHITSSCPNGIYDNFNSPYLLGEGKTSPNGEWKNVYSGHGSTGAKIDDSKTVFYLSPKSATSASQTHAALVKSTDTFCNFAMKFDMNTVKQLRQNSPPNTWETGWIFWRYTDTFHYYWLLIKPNGIELGKKDCDTCTNPVDGQKFLVTKSTPKLTLNTWDKINVAMTGNHIKVFVNNNLVIDYRDTTMSPKLKSGSVAMYSEDAYVLYNNMVVSAT